MPQAEPAASQERSRDTACATAEDAIARHGNLDVAAYETELCSGGINPRHLHPAAITFYVVSGTGVWEEDGKSPVTLHAGDSLLVPAGTIHSHWKPSTTDHLRFLEFIVAEEDKGRSIPRADESVGSWGIREQDGQCQRAGIKVGLLQFWWRGDRRLRFIKQIDTESFDGVTCLNCICVVGTNATFFEHSWDFRARRCSPK